MRVGNKKGGAEKALLGVRDLIVSQLFTKAISFLFLVAFLRILTKEELAVIPLYFAVSAAATLLFSFGIPATLVREVPRLRVTDPSKMYSLLFTSTIIVSLGIIFSTAIAYHFKAQIQNNFFAELSTEIEFSFFFGAMLVGGWKMFLTYVLRSLQMFRGMAIFSGTSDLLIRLLGLLGLLAMGVNGLLAGFVLGSLLVNTITTFKLSSFIFKEKNIFPVLEIFKISWPFYFEGYINYFRSHGDVFLISAILGPTTLAVYYVAKRLYEILITLLTSVEHVIAPSLSQLLGKSIESVIGGYDKLMLLVPLVVVPICLGCAALGYWFVHIIAGSDYAGEAYLTSAAFCIAAIFKNLTTIKTATVFVVCRPIDRLKITFSQFVVYFLLLYFFVKQFGVMGAAVALGCSYLFGSLYASIMLFPTLGKRRVSPLVTIVTLESVLGLLLLVLLQTWKYSIVLVPVYTLAVIFILLLLLTVVAPEKELQKVREVLPAQLGNLFNRYIEFRSYFLGQSHKK